MDTPNYILRTSRLGMRRWKPSDQAVFAQMNQDPEVRKYFPSLLTAAESSASIERFETSIAQNGFGFFAVDLLATGEYIGFVGLTAANFEAPFTPCVEIGWRLKRDAWGFGYATEAATECLRFGLQDQKLPRIYSWTAVQNKPSERVMQKIGMRYAGEFDHPQIPEGNWLKRHLLYEAT